MIKRAAIMRDGTVYHLCPPNRHYHILTKVLNITEPLDSDVFGFLDSDNKFLNRREAFIHAVACGQLKRRVVGDCEDELYSEDLW
jgi:hypothetical protein